MNRDFLDFYTNASLLEVMELAHNEGMKASVTMMYGLGETLAERIEHLQRVREVRARTDGFTTFITWLLQSARHRETVRDSSSASYPRTPVRTFGSLLRTACPT